MSAAVDPGCIAPFPDPRSTLNLRGSPRGRPQETDRPETQHYVIMTSECCPVLCWADREDGWAGTVTGDHQPHESCVWAVQPWIIAVSSQDAASAAYTKSRQTCNSLNSLWWIRWLKLGENSCGHLSKIFQAKQCNFLWLVSLSGTPCYY